MRFATKNEAVKDAFINELKNSGIRFKVKERLSYETFIGYMIEGTLEEIRAQIDALSGEEKEVILRGFQSFKEQILHALEHLKEGETFENLLSEGYWMGDIIDQLMKNSALDIKENKVKLKEGIDATKLKFQFRFPYELAKQVDVIEKVAKQFAFIDLVPEWEIEIKELRIERVNQVLQIAAKYFPEKDVMNVYFALIGKSILANEILKSLGNEKIPVDVIIKEFLRIFPFEIPTERGVMVINATERSLYAILKELEKFGYIDIKGNKVRKIREL
ncbi:hypothetical protein [Thermococcus barophilus]|uniref:Uncharacterized protein n=1 Tax=Thermococcus barophilus TaxID=55802 RepID=A0A0S1XCA1_THEBA|nr:hypothetical protein [Thermococcus barophilus]ALM75422.1 hypothetical protein TBCH5v1_1506 [Thermococcus barophilus]